MGSLAELLCACGASQHVPADRVEAGRLPPCRACGGPLRADGPEPAEAGIPESAAPLAPLAPLASGAGPSRGTDGAELRCPACGGPYKAVSRGSEGRDRRLACGLCGTKVDLSEPRGFTRERVTERPDEEVVERVTRWESVGGEAADAGPAGPADGQGRSRSSRGVSEMFEGNGRVLGGARRRARSRPTFRGLLARIRNLFG